MVITAGSAGESATFVAAGDSTTFAAAGEASVGAVSLLAPPEKSSFDQSRVGALDAAGAGAGWLDVDAVGGLTDCDQSVQPSWTAAGFFTGGLLAMRRTLEAAASSVKESRQQ